MYVCSIEGCGRKYYAAGFCGLHYQRNRRFGSPVGSDRSHAPLAERFWRRVKVAGPDECWEWTGNKAPNGYGRIQEGGKGSPHLSTHRLSYELHCGPAPSDKVVMHSCDHRWCVNPAHLSVGTYKQNTADMLAKGRHARMAPIGTNNGKAVINPDIVRYIRSQPDKNHAELAREIGCGTTTVRGVRSGRVWSHVA